MCACRAVGSDLVMLDPLPGSDDDRVFSIFLHILGKSFTALLDDAFHAFARFRGSLLGIEYGCSRREAGADGLFACRPLLERREVEGNFLETHDRPIVADQQSCRGCTFLKEFLYREMYRTTKENFAIHQIRASLHHFRGHQGTSGKP